ncbi:hypothetical protein GCM10025331_49830 [Actinoplanes utahensis]|nr:hypothetical protein Aut01nite_55840 [Actinoplanes utahensis]
MQGPASAYGPAESGTRCRGLAGSASDVPTVRVPKSVQEKVIAVHELAADQAVA